MKPKKPIFPGTPIMPKTITTCIFDTTAAAATTNTIYWDLDTYIIITTVYAFVKNCGPYAPCTATVYPNSDISGLGVSCLQRIPDTSLT